MRTWTSPSLSAAAIVGGGHRHVRVMLVLVALLLSVSTFWTLQSATTSSGREVAMSGECHQAYRGYMEASDPAEADFWADSWMTFGCESGGYWA